MLSALIKSWRNKWGYDFPFYFAQIAPYKYGNPFEGVLVRDAERRALDVPNTGMAVLSDICDTLNIHPKNKQDAACGWLILRLTGITRNQLQMIQVLYIKELQLIKIKLLFHLIIVKAFMQQEIN